MTLILTIANKSQVIQISDRRLTSLGSVVSDQANKATVFECLDGRFAVGFTGLARSGGFSLEDWLIDGLGRAAPPDYRIREIAERLAVELTRLFGAHPDIKHLIARDGRLTLMLSGYVQGPAGWHIGNILVTN